MPSLPLTPEEEKKVLSFLNLQKIEDLFASIPPALREKTPFKISLGENHDNSGRGLSEHELREYFSSLSQKNWHTPIKKHFLGGGIYDNIIPAIVNQLVLRGEFLTCYTPYQPEISQGTLQAIFEFQTMIARITGMPISNASMYDGATATAEAILMAERLSNLKEKKTLIAASLNPEYRKIAETFLTSHTHQPISIPWNKNGTLDLIELKKLVEQEKPIAVTVGYPNYFGMIEPLDEIKKILPQDCLLIVSTSDLSALSIYESPGKLGADIVVGEAQQLGTPMQLGGPHVGFFATKKEFIRQIPGRLVGESVDHRGQRAYTLTLSTREQHIRREKATSNICTNQGLIALRTSIYLSFLGKEGFIQLGTLNHSLFEYLVKGLEKKGISLLFKEEHYREGVFEIPDLPQKFAKALSQGIIPGIPLKNKFTSCSENSLLITVNPKHTKKDIDDLIEVLS